MHREIPAVIDGVAFVTAGAAGFVGDYHSLVSAQGAAARASQRHTAATVWTAQEDAAAKRTSWMEHSRYLRGYRVRAARA